MVGALHLKVLRMLKRTVDTGRPLFAHASPTQTVAPATVAAIDAIAILPPTPTLTLPTTDARSNGSEAAQINTQYPNQQQRPLNVKVQEAVASLTDARQAAVQAEFLRQAQRQMAIASQPMSSQAQLDSLVAASSGAQYPGYLHHEASLSTSTGENMASATGEESSMLNLTVRAPSNGGAANGETYSGHEPPTTKAQASLSSMFPASVGEAVPTTETLGSVTRNGDVRSSKVGSTPKTGKSKSMLARLRAEEAGVENDGSVDRDHSGAVENASSDRGVDKREGYASEQPQDQRWV